MPNDSSVESAHASPANAAMVRESPRRRSLPRRIAARVVVGYLIYAFIMFSIQRWLVFPRHLMPPPPTVDLRGIDRWWVDSPEGPVEAWFLGGAGATAERPGPALVFAHGNAELIDYYADSFDDLRRLGVSVLLCEFRGYGRSAGSPSQAAITDDFCKFHDRLAALPQVDRARIVYFGRSIGGGAVCALAAQRPPAALVLQSTFMSIRALSSRYLVPSFLVADPFDNQSVLSGLKCPILIAHGRRDSIIPFDHAEALQRSAQQSRLIAYDTDHNDCPPNWRGFITEVVRFLEASDVLQPAEP